MRTIRMLLALALPFSVFSQPLAAQEEKQDKQALFQAMIPKWLKYSADLSRVLQDFEENLAVTHLDDPPISLRVFLLERRMAFLREAAKKDGDLEKALVALEKKWREKVGPFAEKFREFEKALELKPRADASLGSRIVDLRSAIDLESAIAALKKPPKKNK